MEASIQSLFVRVLYEGDNNIDDISCSFSSDNWYGIDNKLLLLLPTGELGVFPGKIIAHLENGNDFTNGSRCTETMKLCWMLFDLSIILLLAVKMSAKHQ